LLLLLNAACLAEKQQIPILKFSVFYFFGGRKEKKGGRKEERGGRKEKTTPCPPTPIYIKTVIVSVC
jgi:hypothetical protein